MNRIWLLQKLAEYSPLNPTDAEFKRRTLEFVSSTEDYFSRGHADGHVVGSAWIMDDSFSQTLLTHHAKLDKWLQLGGHVEASDDTILSAAEREAREESGLDNLAAHLDGILDLDIHEIPEGGMEARHLHYDVRFLFTARVEGRLKISHESKYLQWVPLSHIHAFNGDDSLRRMAEKSSTIRLSTAQAAIADVDLLS